MYRGETVGVVVPAYNEEGFVGDVLATMPPFVDRVYPVDDCSTDGTWAEIRDHAERNAGGDEPEVVPIRHAENRGVGGAIKTGYLTALDDGVDVTAVMAGDGQMDPAHLVRIVDPVAEGRCDYARGNRLLFREDRRDMPTLRLVGNAALTFLTKVASGYWTVSDPQSGYTAISLSALRTVDVEAMYEGYGYCNDLLVRLNLHDVHVVDVAIPATYGDETSHIDVPTYVGTVSRMLLRDFLWRLKTKYVVRDFHPLVLLYAIGAVGVLNTLGLLVRGLRDRDDRIGAVQRAVSDLLVSGSLLAVAMTLDREHGEDLDRTELDARAAAAWPEVAVEAEDGQVPPEQ